MFLKEVTAHENGDGPVVLGRVSKGKVRPAFHIILLTAGYLTLL